MVDNPLIPTYDQALAALNSGDDHTVNQALFKLSLDDGYYIDKVIKAVRHLLQRPDLPPIQIVSIGRALHGLKRLPLMTDGLDIHISLVIKFGGEATSYNLFISRDRFATESGGYINSGHGTDAISGNTFEVENNFRDYTGFYITAESWPDIFNEMEGAELQIEDCSDDTKIDWKHPDGSDFWEWIATHV